MRLSQQGRRMLERYEGRRDKVYLDATGRATVGWGQQLQGPDSAKYPVGSAVPLSLQRQWFREAIRAAELAVRQLVSRPLNQNQFDALVSFTYNVGRRKFHDSTLRRKVNEGDFDAIPGEFQKWTRAGRRRLPGLIRRRQEEAELFQAAGRTDIIKQPQQVGLGPSTLDIPLEER